MGKARERHVEGCTVVKAQEIVLYCTDTMTPLLHGANAITSCDCAVRAAITFFFSLCTSSFQPRGPWASALARKTE